MKLNKISKRTFGYISWNVAEPRNISFTPSINVNKYNFIFYHIPIFLKWWNQLAINYHFLWITKIIWLCTNYIRVPWSKILLKVWIDWNICQLLFKPCFTSWTLIYLVISEAASRLLAIDNFAIKFRDVDSVSWSFLFVAK